MEKLREHPFETEHLAKGDRIKADAIEEAYGVKRGTDKYSLAALAASEYIRRRFADRGETVEVVQRKLDLVILTDEEAVDHADREFRRGIRKAGRVHARSIDYDRSKMTDATVKVHDRNLEVRGRSLQVLRREMRLPAPEVRQRSTPLLRKKV